MPNRNILAFGAARTAEYGPKQAKDVGGQEGRVGDADFLFLGFRMRIEVQQPIAETRPDEIEDHGAGEIQ